MQLKWVVDPPALGLYIITLLQVLQCYCEEALLSQCHQLGFTPDLMCSSCKELSQFNLEPLVKSCDQCCMQDESDADTLYPFAELQVCSWKLSAFPQVQAFVKGNPSDRFPNLSVRYTRGSNPVLKLLDESRSVVQTLSIDKWNTDSVEEFLQQHLRK